MVLSEWGLDPQYVLDHWTDEQLDLMLEALVSRKQREAAALQSGAGSRRSSPAPEKFMPLAKFARKYLKN